MKVHAFDADGFHIGSFEPQLDPLESKAKKKKIYLIPPYTTEVAPPVIVDGEVARWTGKQWKIEAPPSIPEPNTEELTEVSAAPEVTEEEARLMQEHNAKIGAALDRIKAAKAKGLKAADSPKVLEDVLFILGV